MFVRCFNYTQEHEGRLVAMPLSSDQTPYRKDERERVKVYTCIYYSRMNCILLYILAVVIHTIVTLSFFM
jgi:hypothetical protein